MNDEQEYLKGKIPYIITITLGINSLLAVNIVSSLGATFNGGEHKFLNRGATCP